MLIKRDDCCLLVIDVQARLLPAVYDPAGVTAGCRALLEAARAVDVPILVSEHNPKGIGATADALADLVPADSVMEKIYFSCFAEPSARQRIRAADKASLVLAGMEAHVCLGQTALDLPPRVTASWSRPTPRRAGPASTMRRRCTAWPRRARRS